MMADKDRLPFAQASQPDTLGVLAFRADEYMEHVEDLDLTEAQKVEFLRTLWNIMSAFVELGFGVDSVIPMLTKNVSDNGVNALQPSIPTHEFNVAVDEPKNEG